jgi:hypothetical protein
MISSDIKRTTKPKAKIPKKNPFALFLSLAHNFHEFLHFSSKAAMGIRYATIQKNG